MLDTLLLLQRMRHRLYKLVKFDTVITDMAMENKHSGLEVAIAAAQLSHVPSPASGFLRTCEALLATTADHFALKSIYVDEFKRLARLLSLRSDKLCASEGKAVTSNDPSLTADQPIRFAIQ